MYSTEHNSQAGAHANTAEFDKVLESHQFVKDALTA